MVSSRHDWFSHAGQCEVQTTEERAAMSFDICPICDGTGFRNVFEGTKCHTCNGVGFFVDDDPDDEEYDPDYVSLEDTKLEFEIGRGDYLRDRAKDERA